MIAVVAVVLLAVSACGGNDSSAGKTLTQSESGSTVTLQEGETLTLDLDANPTTGFQWQVISDPNARVLEVKGSKYLASEGDQVGGGGIETWTFKAVSAGKTTVVMSYSRPFDPEDVAEMFTFEADVG